MDVVQQFQPQAVYMGRLSHGEDILHSLEAFCRQKQIHHGWFQCLGALKKTTLAVYDQVTHQYHLKDFVGEYEIISAVGNISLREGTPVAHVHVALGDEQYQTVSGHLMPGSTEVFACEFVLFALSGEHDLIRSPEPVTGLPLWQ